MGASGDDGTDARADETSAEGGPDGPEASSAPATPASASSAVRSKPARRSGRPNPAQPQRRPEDIYHVEVDGFEGPLDLLLHLIRQHELDILDIPVSFITSKYVEYLDVMQSLQIDVASEYLVMAATLTHIKSKMLLPEDPGGPDDELGEPEEDPRAELVRRLLEYQKYKHAAEQLSGRPILNRDVFYRSEREPTPEGPAPLAPVSVFKLFEAFDQVLRRSDQTTDHKVLLERISIAERIIELTELLHDRGTLRFEQLFEATHEKAAQDTENGPTGVPSFDLVVTFLALLEMCRRGVARIVQDEPLGPLMVQFAMSTPAGVRVGPGLRRTAPSAPTAATVQQPTSAAVATRAASAPRRRHTPARHHQSPRAGKQARRADRRRRGRARAQLDARGARRTRRRSRGRRRSPRRHRRTR